MILTGDVEEGLPSWQLPWQFNVNTSSANSSSPNPTENPLAMAGDFGIGLFMVSVYSIMQHLAIAEFYTGKNYTINLTIQSMILEFNLICIMYY